MKKGNLRKFFPGGNTCQGFYSYYDYLLPQDAGKILILKGGPGVGKSTFMKKISSEMLRRGYDVEEHCCSADPSSIDGVVIPKLKVGLLDGTSPHMFDPKCPGVVDSILDLGAYWNENSIIKHKKAILALNKEKGRFFKLAYMYLAQAKILKDEIQSYYEDSGCLNYTAFNTQSRALREQIFKDAHDQNRQGFNRHLFASAITPGGLVNHFNSIFNSSKLFILSGNPSNLTQNLVAKIAQEALSLGYDLEVFHCGLEPEKIEHIIIPALDTALVTNHEHHSYISSENKNVHTLNMHTFIDHNKIKLFRVDLLAAQERFTSALNRAISFLYRAKNTHQELESYYIPHMRFEEVNYKANETLQRIIKYANTLTDTL